MLPVPADLSDCQRFEAICRHIHEQLVGIPSLRKLTFQKRSQFAMDLAWIALCLRYAAVIASLPQTLTSSRILSLAFEWEVHSACPEFDSVVHVYEPASEQSFFVNIPMLLDRHIPDGKTAYVRLGPGPSSFSLIADPPLDLINALNSLKEGVAAQTTFPPSFTMKSNLPAESAIPLAAVLLEYPVAYVPTTLDSPFLSKVTLDVYECILSFGETVHTLFKFSCPSELGQQYSHIFSSSQIIASLTDNYLPRICTMAPTVSFEVLHTSQNLDRVAL
ncbi:hypothetical protein C0995_006598 [Termitomyces sp. Mi166|nr:hypothetical protein C0995_006598 [Termitomyces sp. Mi166\